MHVSTLLPGSAPSAAPRSADRPSGARDADFGSVYESGDRRADTASHSGTREDAPRDRTESRRDDAASRSARPTERRDGARAERTSERTAADADRAEGEASDAVPFAAETPVKPDSTTPMPGEAGPAATPGEVSEAASDNVATMAEEGPAAAAAETRGNAATPGKEVVSRTDGATGQTPAARATGDPAFAVATEGPPADAAARKEAPAPATEPARQATAQAAPQAAAQAAAESGRTATPAREEVVVRRVRQDPARETSAPAADAPAPETPRRPVDASAVKAPALPLAGDPAAKIAPDAARADLVDPAALDLAPTDGRSTADHVARAESTLRHDTPRPVMQQMAEAARALRDGPVELALQPEELGKVRMTLTAGPDGAMTMSLQAERPETLELLRRHIGELARELQDMGFQNLNFSFAQDRPAAPQLPWESAESDEPAEAVAAIPLARQGFANGAAPTVTVGGLDLRL